MTWVKLDDGFADHPKVEAVGPLAAWLHVTALCYCARHLTDGAIPKAKAARLADVPQPAKRIAALLEAGLWHDEGEVYRVHDYLDYQPARDEIEAERGAARDRMKKVRAARRSPEHEPNVRPNFVNGSPYPDPTRPVPVEDLPICASTALIPVAAPDTDFDEFWHTYPAKRGKPAAKKAWTAALKRATAEEIIAGARRYAHDPNRDPTHTKYPQGWLNDDRWTDEPIAVGPRLSKSTHNLAAWAERTS